MVTEDQIISHTDNAASIGSASKRVKDIFMGGTLNGVHINLTGDINGNGTLSLYHDSGKTTGLRIEEDTRDVLRLLNPAGMGIEIFDTLTMLGTLDVGVNDTGHDVTFYGATSGKKLHWDESEDQLNIDGNFDVDGNSQFDGTITNGFSGFGSDVSFYGQTAAKRFFWDASESTCHVQGNDDNGVYPYTLNVQNTSQTFSYIFIQNNASAGTSGGAFFGMEVDAFSLYNWEGNAEGSGSFPINFYSGFGASRSLRLDKQTCAWGTPVNKAGAGDFTMTFIGKTTANNGVIKWMDDEDYFDFQDDIVFTNNGGLVFGGMGQENIPTTVTIGTIGLAVIVDGMSVHQVNNVTFQNNQELKVGAAGMYQIVWSVSFNMASGSGQEVEGRIGVNGTPQAQGSAHRKIGTGNDTGNMCGSAILDLAVDDLITIMVENDSTTVDVVVSHASLVLTQVGGT